MATCIRVCKDIGELADLNARLIARDSVYGLEAAMLFASVAEDGIQEIQRHGNPHCQETASVVDRAIDSTYRLLEAYGEPQLIQQAQQGLQQAQTQFQQGRQPAPSVRQPQQGGHHGQQGGMGGSQQPRGGSQSQPQGGQQFQQHPQGSTQQPQQW